MHCPVRSWPNNRPSLAFRIDHVPAARSRYSGVAVSLNGLCFLQRGRRRQREGNRFAGFGKSANFGKILHQVGHGLPRHILPFSNFLLLSQAIHMSKALGIMGLAAIMAVIGRLIIVLINLPAAQ
jgi:hypothetical protein